MKWYFCFDEAASGWFEDMIKVAVNSARLNTDLEPHCIYDGGPSTLMDWLKQRGVTVHRSQVPFRARLFAADVIERNVGTGFSPDAACGYYLPLQIAQVEQQDSHVLFTDCDVMFLKQPAIAGITPAILAAAPEIASLEAPSPLNVQDGFNSGVMLINVAALRARMAELAGALEAHGYFTFEGTGATYDQGLLNTVFRAQWEHLPAALNWRVFFGINPDAAIAHWHGPKPINVTDLLAGKSPDRRYTSASVEKLAKDAFDSYRHHYGLFEKLLAAG